MTLEEKELLRDPFSVSLRDFLTETVVSNDLRKFSTASLLVGLYNLTLSLGIVKLDLLTGVRLLYRGFLVVPLNLGERMLLFWNETLS